MRVVRNRTKVRMSDMHGNMLEWTLLDYMGYPYRDRDGDGRNAGSVDSAKVARGEIVRSAPLRVSAWAIRSGRRCTT